MEHRILPAHIQAHYHIVHGPDDRLLHRPEGIVYLLHDRVLLAAVLYEFVAAELGSIVLRDLGLDIHVGDTGIGRNQVHLLRRVGEIILDILRETQLGIELEDTGIVFLGLAHVHSGCRAEVHYLVRLLEGLQVGLHSAELPLDDDETLVDELRGVDGHLVLVVDSLLVVHRYEHIQHIFSTFRRSVLQGQGQDGSLVLLLADTEIAENGCHHRRHRNLGDVYFRILPFRREIVRPGHEDLAAADRHSVIYRHGHFPALVLSVYRAENHMGRILRGEGERAISARQCIREGHGHRGTGVELLHPEAGLHLVGDIRMKPRNHLTHKLFGLELENLVGDIHLVDIVVIAVETGRNRLVRRVLDDHRRRTEIGHRRAGVLVPGQPSEHYDGEHEPFPLRQQVEQEVEHADFLSGIGILSIVLHCRHDCLLIVFQAVGRPHCGANSRQDGRGEGHVLEGLVLAVLLPVLRLHVDDVVLLEEEARGVEDVLAPDVVQENLLVPVSLPDHRYAVQASLRGKVPGIGNSLEDGDAAVLHRERTVAADGPEHGVFEIQEINRHNRGLDIVTVDDFLPYQLRGLAQVKPRKMEGAENREFDVPVHVHPVALRVESG